MKPSDFTDALGTLFFERGSWCVWRPDRRELDPVLNQAAAQARWRSHVAALESRAA